MPKATHLVVSLPNKPGTLAKVCSVLGEAMVNITAVLAPEATGKGKVRVMVDDISSARGALREAKVPFSEEEVLVAELDNRPGAFGELAGKLARSKINIKYTYATTSPYARAKVVMSVSNISKALEILGE